MRRLLAVVIGCVSVFFVFYTIRLLTVTRGLQRLRAGGQGAYVGAVVFPVLAIAFGWFAWRLWQRGDREPRQEKTGVDVTSSRIES
jgi:hypothetical protein